MFAILPGLQLFLLQNRDQVKYFKDDNPVEAMVLVIVIGAIILLSIIFHLIRGRVNTTIVGKTGKRTAAATPRKFNSFSFYRIASSYGLDREQTRLLEYVFRIDGVTDAERVMRNPALLDRHFRRAYKTIEKSSNNDDEVQQRLVKLFSLRNVIEAAPGIGGASASSGQIAENTPAVLISSKDNYPVRVISSRGQNIIIDMPKNALGTPVRLVRGTKVTLSFFTRSSKGFSYDGQVAGVVDTPNGSGLQITHSGKMKSLVKRMYRRKQTSTRCEFFLVFVEDAGNGKKKAPKLVVDSKRFSGTVQDVSIGGCSIKTSAPIQIGSRLKITMDYNESNLINVLGQVLRVNRSGPMGTIMHIKFLKVPRKAFNSISTLVFGYDEG